MGVTLITDSQEVILSLLQLKWPLSREGNKLTIAEISKMSVLERIQTMEALWDSLTHETTEIKSPDWHGDILSSRMKEIESGNAKFKSLAELKLKI